MEVGPPNSHFYHTLWVSLIYTCLRTVKWRPWCYVCFICISYPNVTWWERHFLTPIIWLNKSSIMCTMHIVRIQSPELKCLECWSGRSLEHITPKYAALKYFFIILFYFIFKLYIIVLVLPNYFVLKVLEKLQVQEQLYDLPSFCIKAGHKFSSEKRALPIPGKGGHSYHWRLE